MLRSWDVHCLAQTQVHRPAASQPKLPGSNVIDSHGEQVTGFGVGDEHWAGHRVHLLRTGSGNVGCGRGHRQLAVHGVERLQHHAVTGLDRQRGLMAGCHRLWPTCGCSASVLPKSTVIVCCCPTSFLLQSVDGAVPPWAVRTAQTPTTVPLELTRPTPCRLPVVGA